MRVALAIHSARVLHPERPWHHEEALAVGPDGRIFATGSDREIEELSSPETRRFDAGGLTLMPGFNDAHVHLWKVGHLLSSMQDVRGVESIKDLRVRISEFAGRLAPGVWYQGRGYNEALLREHRSPNRYDLDAVLGDRPGFLIRTCSHIAVANTAALRIAGITRDTEAPSGGAIERDGNGELTGILHETALGLLTRFIPPPTVSDYEAMILAGCRHQLSLGITSATDPAVFPELVEAYENLDRRGELPQRVNMLFIRRPDGGSATYPLPRKIHTDGLRLDSVKFFADGGLSGATAALSRDYAHSATRGILRFETEELYELALEAHLAGFRIGTHAIGDAALAQVIGVYTRLTAAAKGPRHRIEHVGLPDRAMLDTMAAYGIMAVPQAIFLHELGGNFRRYIDEQYLAQTYPIRSMLAAGIDVALSSDAPVVRNDNPISGMTAALLRRTRDGHVIAPDEAITIEQAIRAYTVGGAIASGDEANRGTLEPGKWADMILLTEDPREVESSQLESITVQAVWKAGRQVV